MLGLLVIIVASQSNDRRAPRKPVTPILHALPRLRGRCNGRNADMLGEAFLVRGSWDIPKQIELQENRGLVSCYAGILSAGVLGLACWSSLFFKLD
jgi:hypothetical protein